jgi:hypothetical protein
LKLPDVMALVSIYCEDQMKTWIAAIGLALVWLPLLPAQTPAPDGLVSPEVHADHTATFRLRAPKANEVT